jgi:hypothetical protein
MEHCLKTGVQKNLHRGVDGGVALLDDGDFLSDPGEKAHAGSFLFLFMVLGSKYMQYGDKKHPLRSSMFRAAAAGSAIAGHDIRCNHIGHIDWCGQ